MERRDARHTPRHKRAAAPGESGETVCAPGRVGVAQEPYYRALGATPGCSNEYPARARYGRLSPSLSLYPTLRTIAPPPVYLMMRGARQDNREATGSLRFFPLRVAPAARTVFADYF